MHKVIAVAIIRNGSHVLINAKKLTYFPLINIRKAKITIFHDVDRLYAIRFNAFATCEWQLSQHKLCWKKMNKISVLLLNTNQLRGKPPLACSK